MGIDEVNDEIIGKRCKCLFLTKIVTGTINTIKKTEHCVQLMVIFDEHQFFDDEKYTKTWIIGWVNENRKGGLQYLEVIDDEDYFNIQQLKKPQKSKYIWDSKKNKYYKRKIRKKTTTNK